MKRVSVHLYLQECANAQMLAKVMDLHDRFLTAATRMTEAEIRERYEQCPNAFVCILAADGGNASLRGYYVLLPLNDAGAQSIRNGSVTSGRQVTTEYLAVRDADIKAMYLSVVCAPQPRARAAAIHGIVRALHGYYHRHDVRHLFVRAATRAGARMLQRLFGTAFDPDGVIHEINLGAYSTITSPVYVPVSPAELPRTTPKDERR